MRIESQISETENSIVYKEAQLEHTNKRKIKAENDLFKVEQELAEQDREQRETEELLKSKIQSWKTKSANQ